MENEELKEELQAEEAKEKPAKKKTNKKQEEIDKVTTPGGITLKGLEEMERCGFTQSVINGLKASR